MSFWKNVGEFFLFRWIFGSFGHHEIGEEEYDGMDMLNKAANRTDDEPADMHSHFARHDNHRHADTHSHVARHDNHRYEEDYEHDNHRHEEEYEHDNCYYEEYDYIEPESGYSQSVDDFLDEQEEIEMMDDLF